MSSNPYLQQNGIYHDSIQGNLMDAGAAGLLACYLGPMANPSIINGSSNLPLLGSMKSSTAFGITTALGVLLADSVGLANMVIPYLSSAKGDYASQAIPPLLSGAIGSAGLDFYSGRGLHLSQSFLMDSVIGAACSYGGHKLADFASGMIMGNGVMDLRRS